MLGAHAPAVSAHVGDTFGAPTTSHALLLEPVLQVLLYCDEAVALAAQLHVTGASGGPGGGWGGLGDVGGAGGGTEGESIGGGGDGVGGGMIPLGG